LTTLIGRPPAGGPSSRWRLLPLATSAEGLYAAALATAGLATLLSVLLPAGQRGVLVATIVASTLGSGLGGLSIDSFLLSRGASWPEMQGRSSIPKIVLVAVISSVCTAVLVVLFAGVGFLGIAAAGAATLTLGNVASSFMLRRGHFRQVYVTRFLGAVVVLAGYLVIARTGGRTAEAWGFVWLSGQILLTSLLLLANVRPALRAGAAAPRTCPSAENPGMRGLLVLHAGIASQMVTYRLDQILLARYAGPAQLGTYALAVAALEFAQSAAVVKSQRVLANKAGTETERELVTPTVKAALSIALVSLTGLLLIGALVADYRDSVLIGLLLVPGVLAVASGKVLSALLLKTWGEATTTRVAVTVAVLAIPIYFLFITVEGAMGAAAGSTAVYALYYVLTRRSLRRHTENRGRP
jgi:O-antigen/teichoic acid export membrane protein